jgi:hypothetical protein
LRQGKSCVDFVSMAYRTRAPGFDLFDRIHLKLNLRDMERLYLVKATAPSPGS